MENFKQRFEIIYKKFYDWGAGNGFKPSKLAFSRFMGVSQGAIQKWEKGQIPSAKDIKAIHDKLGFAWDWLITGEGEMLDEAAKLLAEKDTEIARLAAENRQLTTRLLVEGAGDKHGSESIGKAADGQG